MENYGLVQSSANSCLFVRKCHKKLLVIFFVDDGIIAGADTEIVQSFHESLKQEFKITSGNVMNFLGMQI